MSHSTKNIRNGYIHIMSEEAEALFKTLEDSNMFFEQFSVIFNEYAINKARGTDYATKDDIASLKEMIINLSSKISNINSGNPSISTGGIPNTSLGFEQEESAENVSNESERQSPVKRAKTKVTKSFTEMLNIAKKQQ